jgi:hypothetical protein
MITINFKNGGSLTMPAECIHTTGMYLIAIIEGKRYVYNRAVLEQLPAELDGGNTYG